MISAYYETNEPNATIKFTFKGTALRVIGARHADGSDEIRITIDGHIDKFSVREKDLPPPFLQKFHQMLFEKYDLNVGEHLVEIVLQGDGVFFFQGIECKDCRC